MAARLTDSGFLEVGTRREKRRCRSSQRRTQEGERTKEGDNQTQQPYGGSNEMDPVLQEDGQDTGSHGFGSVVGGGGPIFALAVVLLVKVGGPTG